MHIRFALRAFVVAIAVSSSACLPYNIASTAQPVPVGEHRETTTFWIMPNGFGRPEDSLDRSHTFRGVDAEVRWGIDETSDFGLRVPSMSGLVLSYKRRWRGAAHPDSAALAWQAGAGWVNSGDHAMAELSLLASTRKRGIATWYGGVRGMHVTPLSSGAVKDRPSIGGLLGVQLRLGDATVLPELVVYHDPSALRLRKTHIVLVPSVSVRNLKLPRVMMFR